jgi:hypothetical protein
LLLSLASLRSSFVAGVVAAGGKIKVLDITKFEAWLLSLNLNEFFKT